MMRFVLILLAVLPCTFAQPTWVYSDDTSQPLWVKEYATCRGERQSPIAFWANDVTVDPSIPPLKFNNYNQDLTDQTIKNNGHTIVVEFDFGDNPTPTISGGRLKDSYELVQMNWHWGPVGNLGSEHTIGDDHYPLELQLVHKRVGLDIKEAIEDPSGMAIIAIFYELQDEEDTSISPIVDVIDKLTYKDDTTTVDALNLWDLLPYNPGNFFSYDGSITNPPCWETVTWHVLTETHAVNAEQLRALRNIYRTTESDTGDDVAQKLLFNHRPTQPLWGRKVYARRHKVGLPYYCDQRPSPFDNYNKPIQQQSPVYQGLFALEPQRAPIPVAPQQQIIAGASGGLWTGQILNVGAGAPGIPVGAAQTLSRAQQTIRSQPSVGQLVQPLAQAGQQQYVIRTGLPESPGGAMGYGLNPYGYRKVRT